MHNICMNFLMVRLDPYELNGLHIVFVVHFLCITSSGCLIFRSKILCELLLDLNEGVLNSRLTCNLSHSGDNYVLEIFCENGTWFQTDQTPRTAAAN